jgi:formylglycine-generating enzyme required for sulfatase activity
MGRNVGELDSSSHESPRHTVTFSHSFCLGKYEVTKRQWQAVMGTTPWVGQPDLLNDPNSPAVYISWNDITKAGGFLDKLNQHLTATGQGGGARLPTEAEWEYACRAGTTTRFYWGDDLTYSQVGLYAWYEVNAQQAGQAFSHPVGLKIKSLWGLFDMSGNAWEWCQDYDGTYTSGSVIDPTGPASGTNRILRGGCSVSPGEHCRSACRIDRVPTFLSTDVGFRLAWMY